MTQSWNVSIEQQINPVMVVRAAYVGSESYHQSAEINRNTEVAGVAPYSSFGNILEDNSLATASYNALELGFDRKMAHGLQLQSNFTYSHSIDLASSANVSFGNPELGDPFSLKWNRGNSNMDMPWNWVTNLIYQAPLLKNQNKLLQETLGGLATERHHDCADRQPLLRHVRGKQLPVQPVARSRRYGSRRGFQYGQGHAP